VKENPSRTQGWGEGFFHLIPFPPSPPQAPAWASLMTAFITLAFSIISDLSTFYFLSISVASVMALRIKPIDILAHIVLSHDSPCGCEWARQFTMLSPDESLAWTQR
jgi:hypothetical protein